MEESFLQGSKIKGRKIGITSAQFVAVEKIRSILESSAPRLRDPPAATTRPTNRA